MESDFLKTIKNLEKKHQWKKAVQSLEQYMKEHPNNIGDLVYVTQARCHRMLGETNLAKQTLTKGKAEHPNSLRILVELHNLYDFLGEWYAAEKVAKTLVIHAPQEASYYFRLGRTYSFLLEYDKAEKSYKRALELKHGLPFQELVTTITSGFSNKPAEFTSTYIYIEGKNNLGAFIHENGTVKYFTKISYYQNERIGAGREESFYKRLSEDFTQLKDIAPRYIHSKIIDGIIYITMEMIDSSPSNFSDIKQVIQISQLISTINYNAIIEKYPRPNYVFQYKKGRAISVVHFFTQIHLKKYNEKIFRSLYLIAKQHNYPKTVRSIIQRLESCIMTSELYHHIIPEQHYTLLHGDFAHQNILIKKTNRRPCIIDWSSYTIGPHFIDVGRYFTSLLLPYADIKTIYLEDEQTGGLLASIEKIFFLYAIILFYFQKHGRKGLETELSTTLLPALEDLEILVLSFTKRMDGVVMEEEQQTVVDQQLAEKELKIKQLNERISIIEEEKKYLNKRLNDVLNSKSWKITAPLRLFIERKKKHSDE